MYSKNDYRYYLENQLIHSDDFLAHYGVKGMKWKQHKAVGSDMLKGVLNGASYDNFITRPSYLTMKEDDARGRKLTNKVKSQQTISQDQAQGKKRTEQIKGKSSEYLREYESNSKKNNFPTSKKKKKSNRRPLTLDSFRRVKPKGKKLKGSRNITVTHNTVIK